jgi:hypothetical protein
MPHLAALPKSPGQSPTPRPSAGLLYAPGGRDADVSPALNNNHDHTAKREGDSDAASYLSKLGLATPTRADPHA